MKNQKGFTLAEGLLFVLVLSVIGFAGYTVWDNNQEDEAEVVKVTQDQDASTISEDRDSVNEGVTADPYKGWQEGSFTLSDLTYKLPPNWEDVSDNTQFQDTEFKYEEVKIKAADGFVLTMSVNDLPRGYGYEPGNVVLEFMEIDSENQWIIADNKNEKVNRIYVGSGITSVGEKIATVPNVGKDGLNIELIGAYFPSELELVLSEFNDKKSVQEAKKVFESLVFN